MRKFLFIIVLLCSLALLGCIHKHEYLEEITAPTCLEQGYTEFTCSCGENYKANYVLPTGHSYGEWVVTTQPTETSKGVKEKICRNCNDKVLETIPLLNHTHKYEEKIVEATCEQQGYTEYRCSCGESYKENYIDAKGHSYGEWTKIKDATETEYGLEQRECSVCSHIDTQLIPLLSHTHKFSEKIIMPTCVEKGYTEFTCLCGETYKDKYVDAKGHLYSEWFVIKEATFIETGIKEKECSQCGSKVSEEIPMLKIEDIINFDEFSLPGEVIENFTLPISTIPGVETIWASDNEAIVIEDFQALVTRSGFTDVEVKLTATIIVNGEQKSQEFNVIVKSLDIPKKITINAGELTPVEGEERTYYLKKGSTAQLLLEFEGEKGTISKEVIWNASNRRVNVDSKGLITGLIYGPVEILATAVLSVIGYTISDKITIMVVESLDSNEVLLLNKKAIEEMIPQYITSDYTFPTAPNMGVYTEYYVGSVSEENRLYYGEYHYVEGEDRQETMMCVLEYEGKTLTFEFVIYSVADENCKEFLALNNALDKVFNVLEKYIIAQEKQNEKIEQDINLPGQYYLYDMVDYGVTIKYQCICFYEKCPIDFEINNDSFGNVFVIAKYNKPTEDCKITLKICFSINKWIKEVEYEVLVGGNQ